MNITAIMTLVEIDGQVCLAPIDPERYMLFVGMLSAYQTGDQKESRLIRLPPDIAEHVYAISKALAERKQPAHQGEGRE